MITLQGGIKHQLHRGSDFFLDHCGSDVAGFLSLCYHFEHHGRF